MYAKINFGKCNVSRKPVTMIIESSDFIDVNTGEWLAVKKFEQDCHGHTHTMTVKKDNLTWHETVEATV